MGGISFTHLIDWCGLASVTLIYVFADAVEAAESEARQLRPTAASPPQLAWFLTCATAANHPSLQRQGQDLCLLHRLRPEHCGVVRAHRQEGALAAVGFSCWLRMLGVSDFNQPAAGVARAHHQSAGLRVVSALLGAVAAPEPERMSAGRAKRSAVLGQPSHIHPPKAALPRPAPSPAAQDRPLQRAAEAVAAGSPRPVSAGAGQGGGQGASRWRGRRTGRGSLGQVTCDDWPQSTRCLCY